MTNRKILQQGSVLHRLRGLLWQGSVLPLIIAAGCSQAKPVASAGSPPPFTIHEVASFSTPWAMAFLPGSGVRLTGMALLTEKEGRLWLVDTANGAKQEVAGVPTVAVAGQGGLGDVVVHPDFAGNQRIYLSFVEQGVDETRGAALGHGRLILGSGPPRIDGFKVIWRQVPKVTGSGHFSHRIAFGPDGLLYLTSGERQKGDPAQALDGNLGKVLRLTDEGVPAPGNPWAASGGVAAQYWTIGHRNLLGLAFAPDGRLWETEMGPQGGDELNLILAGKNYGWPRASNGSDYGVGDIPDHRPGDGYEPPKTFWDPSISPGGLLIYSGALFPQWQGDALIPALSGEALLRVDIKGERATKADQWPMGARIRAVDQGPDGSIYLIEDKGRLVRLDPAKR
ncbi:MAG: PQQ-dependent sugar dehydrogenase [Sphingomonas bacterium]|nr:PQQ-dependent sugar dehydrogenase [Sphingomonas bacterium]